MIKVLLLETPDEEIAQTTQFYPHVNWPTASGAQLDNGQQALLFPCGLQMILTRKFFIELTTTNPWVAMGMGCRIIPRTYSVRIKNRGTFIQNQRPNR